MRLRFTIRDLLWLTAFVALAWYWWLDRRDLARKLWYVQPLLKLAMPATETELWAAVPASS